jgi:hypothetical protein
MLPEGAEWGYGGLIGEYIRNVGGYVCCFSENGDELSQWRQFAADGRGYCLGFDVCELLEFRKPCIEQAVNPQNAGCLLSKVSYIKSGEGAGPSGVLTGMSRSDVAYLCKALGKGDDSCENGIVQLLAQIALSCKHGAYSVEREWRLFRVPSDGDSERVRLRGGDLRRYVVIAGDAREVAPAERAMLLPLRSIRIGPRLDAERAEKSLRNLLGHFNWAGPEIEIQASEIPVRR